MKLQIGLQLKSIIFTIQIQVLQVITACHKIIKIKKIHLPFICNLIVNNTSVLNCRMPETIAVGYPRYVKRSVVTA